MEKPLRIDRRTTLKWVLSASASLAAGSPRLALASAAAAGSTAPADAEPHGYGTDPDVMRTYRSGELWPLTLSAEQRQTAAALCDLIIPADEKSPSASAVGVVDFIDEWISAPYPEQKRDRPMLLAGLAALEQQALNDFKKPFANLSAEECRTLCDPICYLPNAPAARQDAAKFFARFRDLSAGAFYTTAEGTRDVGFVGNVALSRFDGPPPEVLKQIGLT